jgi:hypothetical protein
MGTHVFRVYDPDNGGAASPLFTVQVGVVPTSALMPEATGNFLWSRHRR